MNIRRVWPLFAGEYALINEALLNHRADIEPKRNKQNKISRPFAPAKKQSQAQRRVERKEITTNAGKTKPAKKGKE